MDKILSCLHSKELNSYLGRRFVYERILNNHGHVRIDVSYPTEEDLERALGKLFREYNVKKTCNHGQFKCEENIIALYVKSQISLTDFDQVDYNPQTQEIYKSSSGAKYLEKELQVFRDKICHLGPETAHFMIGKSFEPCVAMRDRILFYIEEEWTICSPDRKPLIFDSPTSIVALCSAHQWTCKADQKFVEFKLGERSFQIEITKDVDEQLLFDMISGVVKYFVQ